MHNSELFVHFTEGAFLWVIASQHNQKQQVTLCIVLTYHSQNIIFSLSRKWMILLMVSSNHSFISWQFCLVERKEKYLTLLYLFIFSLVKTVKKENELLCVHIWENNEGLRWPDPSPHPISQLPGFGSGFLRGKWVTCSPILPSLFLAVLGLKSRALYVL